MDVPEVREYLALVPSEYVDWVFSKGKPKNDYSQLPGEVASVVKAPER